jgi:murein DD-endopeptidase MepM/ murein hydrolase activator NlpD
VVGPASLSGSFGWPATGRLVGRFGAVGEGERNDGIEIAVAPAAPILASADGTVAFVGQGVATYGGMILIRHGSGWITAYGRVASASVTRGQQVTRGQMIGRAGKGSAPQVHFQLRRDRKPVDPLGQLPAR